VLKYTLGALAAAVILIGAALVILLQVADGGARQGPARAVIVSASDSDIWPLDFEVKPGEIIELQLQNHSSVPRSLRLSSPHVEQLPEAPLHDAPVRGPVDGILIDAPAGLGGSAYVRFVKKGEYRLGVAFTGTFFPPPEVLVTVK
jgi:hypothetical protein